MTRTHKKLGVAAVIAMVPLTLAATLVYACTNYVGVLQVWGDSSGGCSAGSCTSTSGVKVTGNDTWNGSQAMTQTVNSTVSKATHSTGSFYIEAEVSGSNSLNQSGTGSIWYDVNTIPIGYTSHTTWGGDPSYDCMTWNMNNYGVKNNGSVQINTSGKIVAAASGSLGGGSSVTLYNSTAGIAGPYSLQSNLTANTSPQEAGVCLSDSTSTNGNQAPLTIV
ncbi:MAG: hypothetical protein JOZ75_03710 [Candidatus Dormibacteraeota bacterium]|nr:hypothetical protein [Candidatus Dormibacteraeota bacterium]